MKSFVKTVTVSAANAQSECTGHHYACKCHGVSVILAAGDTLTSLLGAPLGGSLMSPQGQP